MIRYIFSSKKDAVRFERSLSAVAPKGEIGVVGEAESDKEDTIVHIGYCKGEMIGRLVEPSVAVDSESEEIIRIDSLFPLEHRVLCSGKEAGKKIAKHTIYDEDLFKIGEMPHKKLYSIKIVNDDGNRKFNKEESWIIAAKLVADYLRT